MDITYVDSPKRKDIVFDNTVYERVLPVPKQRGRPQQFLSVSSSSDLYLAKESAHTKRTLEDAQRAYLPQV